MPKVPIKWKSSKTFNPQIILDKIEEAKSITDDGRVTYKGWDYHDYFASIYAMVDVPAKIMNELNVDSLLSRGLSRAAKAGKITHQSFIQHLNALAAEELRVKEKEYRLVTSLSIWGKLPFKRRLFDKVQVRFVDQLPEKYHANRSDLSSSLNNGMKLRHSGYTDVIVTSKAKSIHGAASKSLNTLDFVRALMSLFSNSSMELFGNTSAPINKIRLGEIHSLHNVAGKLSTKQYWYEPNFYFSQSFQHAQPEVLVKNFRWCLDKLEICKYDRELKDSLLRFVRALDEKDANSAAIRLWGALEVLACPGGAKYDKIVKRCAFVFDEPEYHEQVLENLREYRNGTIHAGDQSQRAKTFCYQMQFYFRNLFLFHLYWAGKFVTLDEANTFLDLPTEKSKLLFQKQQIDEAIKYRRFQG